jgi:hypothetical protein
VEQQQLAEPICARANREKQQRWDQLDGQTKKIHGITRKTERFLPLVMVNWEEDRISRTRCEKRMEWKYVSPDIIGCYFFWDRMRCRRRHRWWGSGLNGMGMSEGDTYVLEIYIPRCLRSSRERDVCVSFSILLELCVAVAVAPLFLK